MASEPATPRRTVVRHAARVLVVDGKRRLLLFLFRYTPEDGVERNVWIAPGGGLEAGETHEAAAARELWEETGLRLDPGPCVWTRSHTNLWTDFYIEQHERYFVALVDEAEIVLTNQGEFERALMPEYRWWSHDEIAASTASFAPQSLSTLLPAILEGRYPDEPYHIEEPFRAGN